MISVLQEAQRPALDQMVSEEPGEFEIVMGRSQLASTMLLMLVLLVVFSAGAYVIGKSAGPRAAAPVQAASVANAPVAFAPVEGVPVAVEKPAAAGVGNAVPVYGDQVAGKVYLQVGAVDRGLAAIWGEGLSTHGLDAFVAPGPSDKMWRVVIGPLPNPEAFQRAKAKLDELGINTFGRKQQ
jgi:cell division septation protein DedD